MYESNDQVKLLLEALQMSVSSCMQHPELSTLRLQMVGRLMSANHSPWVAVRAKPSLLAHDLDCIADSHWSYWNILSCCEDQPCCA